MFIVNTFSTFFCTLPSQACTLDCTVRQTLAVNASRVERSFFHPAVAGRSCLLSLQRACSLASPANKGPGAGPRKLCLPLPDKVADDERRGRGLRVAASSSFALSRLISEKRRKGGLRRLSVAATRFAPPDAHYS
jgi:hypothetical protein